ncbi:DUF2235 domain-containing protein [Geodermatophilus sp. SYSU D00815]
MNIVVLLDGTWSDANTHTNIAQLDARVPRRVGAAVQEVCYVEGVGTGPFDRLRGGILGAGLDDDIRQAYGFIAARHRSDDRIHLLGYSRGAFAARSLAGMIAKCGLVDEADLPATAVFERYRDTDAPGLREMQEGEKPARTAEDVLVLARSRLVRIRFIGVFDTVGALGIPGGIGRLLNRRRYAFHDTRLSGLVDVACHAVAVDEHRKQFAPTLWTSVPIPIPQHPTRVEQRWFVGEHANVGGGGTATPAVDNPLSVLAREWIADRAVAAGLVVEPPPVPLTGKEWAGRIHDFYGSFLGRLARLVPGTKPYLRPVRTTIGEALDGSVVRRWREGKPPYRPRNPYLEPWIRSQL